MRHVQVRVGLLRCDQSLARQTWYGMAWLGMARQGRLGVARLGLVGYGESDSVGPDSARLGMIGCGMARPRLTKGERKKKRRRET